MTPVLQGLVAVQVLVYITLNTKVTVLNFGFLRLISVFLNKIFSKISFLLLRQVITRYHYVFYCFNFRTFPIATVLPEMYKNMVHGLG